MLDLSSVSLPAPASISYWKNVSLRESSFGETSMMKEKYKIASTPGPTLCPLSNYMKYQSL